MSGAESSRSGPGWRIGTLRGVPVYLGRTWPIIAVLIVMLFGPQLQRILPELGARAYVVAFAYAVLLLISVLVHEASHALMGQARGYHVSRIVADLWGGHTAYDTADSTPGSSALVAVVGPLSNGVLALGAWVLLRGMPSGVPSLLIGAIAWTNGFVALFNLLPGLPLDGGFLVDALVWKITGSRSKGMVVAGWCGRIMTILIVVWAVVLPTFRGERPSLTTVIWALLIGGFLWVGASSAINAGKMRGLLGRVTLRAVAEPVTIVEDSTPLSSLPAMAGRAVVVHSGARGIWGLVDPATAASVAADGHGAVPLSTLAQAQPLGWVLNVPSIDDDVTGVLGAVQSAGAEQVVVLTADTPPVAGLVRTERLVSAIRSAEGSR